MESARLAENFEAAAIAEHQQDNEVLLDRRRADDRWEDSPRHEAAYIAGSFIDHLHLKVKFYEAVKDQLLEHRERVGADGGDFEVYFDGSYRGSSRGESLYI